MHVVAAGARLHGFGLVLGVLLACYLVVGQPFVGAWSARRFRESRSPHARLDRYHRTLTLEWGLYGLALIVLLLSPGLSPRALGMRWPGFSGAALPYTLVGLFGLAVSIAGLVALRGRMLQARSRARGPSAVMDLLPRTRSERRTFTAVAVTAGVCEEFLYRSFGLAVLAALVPSFGPLRTVVVAALAFGLAHAYQGAAGIAATAVLGGCLAVLFLGTGSLLLPVAFHVLIDLRVLVLPVAGPAEGVLDGG